MYAVAAVGLITVLLSLAMIANPTAFGRGILAFAEKPYFHIFEIVSRVVLGGILIVFADSTRYPFVIGITGGIFVLASLILIVGGAKRHREFAARSAGFVRIFRPAGIVSLAFGVFLLYAAVAAR